MKLNDLIEKLIVLRDEGKGDAEVFRDDSEWNTGPIVTIRLAEECDEDDQIGTKIGDIILGDPNW